MTRSFALLLCAALLAACDAPTQEARPLPGPAALRGAPPPAAPATDPHSGLPWVSRAALPREGQRVLTVIGRGGPFTSAKDGATFGNREGLLPRQNRAYYREYTVPTPGETDRGARRVVCGDPPEARAMPALSPEARTAECYYTADHYASFRRIRP